MGKTDDIVIQTAAPSQAAEMAKLADDLVAVQQILDGMQTRVREQFVQVGTLLDVANQCIDNAVIGMRESALKLALGEIKR